VDPVARSIRLLEPAVT